MKHRKRVATASEQEIPVQLAFQNMPVDDEVEETCWSEAALLNRMRCGIASCRVVISNRRRPRKTSGAGVEIVITLVFPDSEIQCRRTYGAVSWEEGDLCESIRRAFEMARGVLARHDARSCDGG